MLLFKLVGVFMLDTLKRSLQEIIEKSNVVTSALVVPSIEQQLEGWVDARLVKDFVIYIRNSKPKFQEVTTLSWITVGIKFDDDETYNQISLDI